MRGELKGLTKAELKDIIVDQQDVIADLNRRLNELRGTTFKLTCPHGSKVNLGVATVSTVGLVSV